MELPQDDHVYNDFDQEAAEWHIAPRVTAFSGAIRLTLQYRGIKANVTEPDQVASAQLLWSKLLAPISVDVPVGGAVPIGGGAIINAGVATDPWIIDNQGDVMRVSRGLRIGFDVHLPVYDGIGDIQQRIDAFSNFYNNTLLSVDDALGIQWSLKVSADFLSAFLAPQFDNVPTIEIPATDDSATSVDIVASGTVTSPVGPNVTGGDFNLKLVLTIYRRLEDESHPAYGVSLGLKICGITSPTAQGFAKAVSLGLAGVGVVTGPALGIIIGATYIAGLFTVLGVATLDQKLKGEKVLPTCDQNAAPNCQDCWTAFNVPIFSASLQLDNIVGNQATQEVELRGSVEPNFASLAAATMGDLRIVPWTYASQPCEGVTDPDPIAYLNFDNLGDYPLSVCEIAQDTLNFPLPSLLIALDRNGQPLNYPIEVPPRETFHFVIKALIAENASAYNAQRPPPLLLRVRTSGGAREVDLNHVVRIANSQVFVLPPAELIDPSLAANLSAIAQLLCKARLTGVHGFIWRAADYTDPVPYDSLGLGAIFSQVRDVMFRSVDGLATVVGEQRIAGLAGDIGEE